MWLIQACSNQLSVFHSTLNSQHLDFFRRIVRHSDLREAMSIEKRYFTSDLSNLS